MDDPSSGSGRQPGGRLRVAYVMSRFPKLTETFILDEMIAVEAQGVRVELFPLLRERAHLIHPEAEPWIRRAHYLPFISASIIRANLAFLARHPRRYVGTLLEMIRGTAGSLNFLVGGIGIFPKVVRAAAVMSDLGVAHIQCHFATHPALAGFLVHRLVGIPFSFTAHGSDLHVERRMLCRKVEEAAFVVTISRSNAAVMEQECGGRIAKLEVIHCGVDQRRFGPTDGTRLDRRLSIACIGTLHEVKGQRYLIEACAQLAGRGVEFRCSFVGDGPDRAALERLVDSLGLTGRVAFLGQRTRTEVLALLAETDVVVTPSVATAAGKREGLPVVLIEAMAAGVPVVASHLSGIPELVENNVTGFTVPPGDPGAIADAIERLSADAALRHRLSSAARERVAADFDLAKNAARLKTLFERSAVA